MTTAFDGPQRAALQKAAATEGPLQCPVCDVPLSQQAVAPGAQVSYVRRRLWLLCPKCRRTASVDLPHRRPQG